MIFEFRIQVTGKSPDHAWEVLKKEFRDGAPEYEQVSMVNNTVDDSPENRARALVNEQAKDEGLWFEATMVTEAYLQAALRELHLAVENT